MKLYKYESYEEYVSVQEEGNKRKIDKVWVRKKVIDAISDYIKTNMKEVEFGLCHGTRNGAEQKYFIDNLGIKVIGTEISSTATQFPNTIQWDFHNVKDEWINNVDFIYTNAIDHSFDPDKAVNSWISCLNENGCLFLEHTSGHKVSTRLDPFGSKAGDIISLLEKYGEIISTIEVVDIMGTKKPANMNFMIYVVKKKNINKLKL